MLKLRTLGPAALLPLYLAAQTPAPDAVQEWVRGAAIPLATPVAGHGFDDMQALRKVVGVARIVSLGEATHGTREFFQLKHRMLEFLAAEMGFTIFSIEASMPEAYRLNDYVLHGKGDPARLIAGMYFWTWNTEEVLDMVRWMRKFNESGKGPVQFTGFDMQYPNVANDIVRDFVARADPEYAAELAEASKLALAPIRPSGPGFGSATGRFPVAAAQGKTIRFSGYIKTQDVTGYAGLWWRADRPEQRTAFSNLRDAAPKGTTDWQRYELELEIPSDTFNINFGVLVAGSGTAWFDDLKVEIDGEPYTGDEYDFTFEGQAVKGLGMTMAPYISRLDDHAHGGKQSLRISGSPAPVNPNAVDPKVVAAAWTKVLDHLQSSRERYAETAKPDDIQWAIQNARIVIQCMQSRANQVSRDTSMAANVKWILDQSPAAKIVLWAHNGHVMAGSTWSMGSALRRMYGRQMIVFGFSFLEGSFQAVSQGGRGLKDFTVPPAPAGSLDATLGAGGPPLFALDLRAAPKDGPVADWLRAPHRTRSIGSMYPEDSDYAFMTDLTAPEAYDALLFVAKTTAARKNPPLPGAPGPATIEFKKVEPAAGDDSGLVEYRDPEFDVSVKMPSGWRMAEAFRWGNRETTGRLLGPGTAEAGRLYFQMKPNPNVEAELVGSPASKAAQRVQSGLTDYHIRPGSVERRTIGGLAALTCIGEYTRGGIKWVEYLTWVRSENANAQFFAMVAESEFDALRTRLDPIIATLRIP